MKSCFRKSSACGYGWIPGVERRTDIISKMQRGGTMALTKIDLVGLIQEEIGLTKKEGVASLDSLFQIMKDELIRGNPVKISGFGKWTVMKKHARKGRNPKSGESITIDARKVVSFKISNVLRQSLSK
jgi:integration host factor subunit alpha